MESQKTVTLFRPVGQKELDLIKSSTHGRKYPINYATNGLPWYVHLNGLAMVRL